MKRKVKSLKQSDSIGKLRSVKSYKSSKCSLSALTQASRIE